jgi:hypothetical protein
MDAKSVRARSFAVAHVYQIGCIESLSPFVSDKPNGPTLFFSNNVKVGNGSLTTYQAVRQRLPLPAQDVYYTKGHRLIFLSNFTIICSAKFLSHTFGLSYLPNFSLVKCEWELNTP